MAYANYEPDYNSLVHTLTVNGKITTEIAKVLIECQEKLEGLAAQCTLQLKVHVTPQEPQTQVEKSEAV